MSQIIINEKNFERFSKRMQKLLNVVTNGQLSIGKLQSQEIFSRVLGAENLHTLRIQLKMEKSKKDYTFKLDSNEVMDFFNHKLSNDNEIVFIKKLNLRINYIITRISDITGYEMEGWFYGFIPQLKEFGITYSPISSDFKNDMKDNILYCFSYLNKKVISYDKYIEKFPTKWLYEDFENVLTNEVTNYCLEERKNQSLGRKLK